MTLKIRKLSKRYHNKWVLRDVNLEIEPGTILGVIGENSSGKSTFLRSVYGSEKINSGEIAYNGQDLTNSKERGFSFYDNQKPNGLKGLFAKEIISESEKQTEALTKQLEIAESLILLDNPCFGLDLQSKEQIFGKLKNIVKDKNLTVILASNNEADIFGVCDQVAVLSEGEISQTGTPRAIYENPNSVASARALGRCNLILSRRITFTNQNILEFQTLTGDHRLRVDKVEKSILGAITNNISLAIRPEHISISFGASFPEDNLLKAQIAAIDYLGATTRIHLEANGLKLEALVLRLVGLNIGDECMVGLPPDRILILKS